MADSYRIFNLSEPKIKIDLAGLEIGSTEVYVKIENSGYPIKLQKSLKDSAPMLAEEYFAYIKKCKVEEMYPCVCVEEDYRGRRAWLDAFLSDDYLSDVMYLVENRKFVVAIC